MFARAVENLRPAVPCLALAVILFIPLTTDGQSQDLVFEHFTVEQGLSDKSVFGILQDRKGFMWFGTTNGLNKYDGYHFTVYYYDPLDSTSFPITNSPLLYEDKVGTFWLRGAGLWLTRCDMVTGTFANCFDIGPVPDFLEDAAGTLWFATAGNGLKKYDRPSGTFIHFGLSNDTLRCICADSNESGRILWIGGEGGVDKFNCATGTFTHVERCTGFHVTKIHKDRAGVLWIGTEQALYTFDEATGTLWRCPVAKWRCSESVWDCVHSFFEDRRGVLWIGAGDELFSFERATQKFMQYRAEIFPIPLPLRILDPVYEDRTGRLWLNNIREGLSRFDPARKRIVSYVHNPKDPSSLSDNAVNQVFEDRSGALWIGTVWGGINKVDRARKAFRHYTQNPAYPWSLIHNLVYGICEARSGRLWVATRGGLDRFDRNTGMFTHFQHDPRDPYSLSSNIVRAVLEDRDGTIWVGTEGSGLDRLDFVQGDEEGTAKARFRHYTHDPRNPRSIGSNQILSLYEDRSGKIWIGTMNAGLDQLSKDSGVFVHYRADPNDTNSLSCDWVNAICEDSKGRLWVGTGFRNGCALSRLDRARTEFSHFRRHRPGDHTSERGWEPCPLQGIGPGSVHSIYEDRSGTIWIGTTFGLSRSNPSTEGFTHFWTSRDIGGNFIAGILEDTSGCLWLKTNQGVSKFDPRTATFKAYGRSEGVPISPTWGKACYKSRNGEMFFGGTNGFVRFHPDSIKDNLYVPPVVITAFKKFDKPVRLDTVISEKKLLELSYKDNVISFDFVALNYTSPEKNQYAYMLEGFDKDWIYCGTRRYASYTNLDGGTYVFRVKGSNNDGIWNEAGTSIVLLVTPPFWKTWWFTTLFFVVTATFLGAMIWYIEITRLRRRLRASEQEHALERERLRISRDMHDEVGANLTKISLLSELALQKSENAGGASHELLTISQSAREVIKNISAILWAINPQDDRLDHLTAYVRHFVAEYLEMTSVRPRFDFPNDLPGYPLSAEVRRNIFLTLKEAIHNVVKHAGATAVDLRCRISDHELEFDIQDNGRGFVVDDQCRHGNGLANMKKRIEDVHGDLQVRSEPGVGTRIRFTVPLS